MTFKDLLYRLFELDAIRERFAVQEERWITGGDDTCPMCSDLEDLGWLPLKTLPRYKQAHSKLGEGRWKAPDSSCQCTKGYRRVGGENQDPKQLEYTPGQGWSAFEIKKAEDKVKIILEKYQGKCTCK